MACACFKKMCKVCYPIDHPDDEEPAKLGCETADVLYAPVHPLKLDSYIQRAACISQPCGTYQPAIGGFLQIPASDVAEMKWFGKIQEAVQEFTKIEGRALQRTPSHASEDQFLLFSDQPMIDEVPVIKLSFSPGVLQNKCSIGVLGPMPPGPGRGAAIWKYTETVSVGKANDDGLGASIGTYKQGVETVVPDLMPRLLARRGQHDFHARLQAQLPASHREPQEGFCRLTAFEVESYKNSLAPKLQEGVQERRGSKRKF